MWMVEDGELHINCQKVDKGGTWPSALAQPHGGGAHGATAAGRAGAAAPPAGRCTLRAPSAAPSSGVAAISSRSSSKSARVSVYLPEQGW